MCTVTAIAAAAALLAIPATAGAGGTANRRAETEMVSAINQARAENGLEALRRSRSLSGSARRYSNWLMENDTFRHLSSIRASSRFSMLGEALAMHAGRRFDVRGTLSQWLGSPPHRALVLSPLMRWFGTGVTRGRMGAARSTVWVLHLGRIHPPGVELPSLPLP